jgi:hypothetical protein
MNGIFFDSVRHGFTDEITLEFIGRARRSEHSLIFFDHLHYTNRVRAIFECAI